MVNTTENNTKNMLLDIAAFAVWSLFVLVVTGCDQAYLSPVRIVILILGFAGLSFFLIKNSGKDRKNVIMAVLMIAAVGIRTFYVLYTGAEQRQHDMGEFDTNLLNNYHSEYIEYLLENHRLLAEDVRDHWQFYHPPLHHFICAVFFSVYRTLAPSCAHNWEALQCLSLFWSLITFEIMRKFIDLFKVSGSGRVISFLVVAVHPQLIVFSGALNNDPLALLFSVAALYLAWKWYENRNTVLLFATSFCIGCGMMTKLSAGLVAVPVAFLMLKVLFESKEKLKTFLIYIAFVLVCAPLGLWYQIRNYILWKVPITYIAVPDTDYNPGLLLEDVPFWKRFFVFGNKGYNIIEETMNQAVFDGDYYNDHMILALVGYVLLAAFMLLAIMAVAGLILAWLKKRDTFNTFLTVLVAAELISYVMFCFRYPYSCTMSFRYIVPVLIAISYHCGTAHDKGPHLVKLFTDVACYAFAAVSFVFYLLVWIK